MVHLNSSGETVFPSPVQIGTPSQMLDTRPQEDSNDKPGKASMKVLDQLIAQQNRSQKEQAGAQLQTTSAIQMEANTEEKPSPSVQ